MIEFIVAIINNCYYGPVLGTIILFAEISFFGFVTSRLVHMFAKDIQNGNVQKKLKRKVRKIKMIFRKIFSCIKSLIN